MNKQELINQIAKETGFTKKDTESFINSFTKTVQDTVKANDKLTLIGFGTFELRERAERKGRNPRTNEEIVIPATKAPAFKPGKNFKEFVNTASTSKKKKKK
jgi:DNA-binding protein HU-beta